IPALSPVNKAGPVAVMLHLVGRLVDIEREKPSPVLVNGAAERTIWCLVRAGVAVAVLYPAALLPVGNLAAVHEFDFCAVPNHPRACLADGLRYRPAGQYLYAHAGNPTSALVEAKIFSPSLTLSYTDSALAKNGS